MKKRINRIVIVTLALVVALGSTIPTFAAGNNKSYYPYKSAAAKKHATEMAFKSLEKKTKKATSKKTTTKNVTTKTKAKTSTKNNKNSAGKHLNVNEAYTILNKFRTTRGNQWYWNSNNRTKTYTYGLKALKRDATLEKIAKVRAQEQWTRWYSQGKRDHTRPNGKDCWTAYTKGSNPSGECLHWDVTVKEVITNPSYGFAETNLKYAGQGHRRLLLMKTAKRVGIACYEKNGKNCWAVCLGY